MPWSNMKMGTTHHTIQMFLICCHDLYLCICTCKFVCDKYTDWLTERIDGKITWQTAALAAAIERWKYFYSLNGKFLAIAFRFDTRRYGRAKEKRRDEVITNPWTLAWQAQARRFQLTVLPRIRTLSRQRESLHSSYRGQESVYMIDGMSTESRVRQFWEAMVLTAWPGERHLAPKCRGGLYLVWGLDPVKNLQ